MRAARKTLMAEIGQDMRAGIQRLAAIVAADPIIGIDPSAFSEDGK